ELIGKVYRHPLVHVSHAATITSVAGHVGNFTTTLHSEGQRKTIRHGAAILATGAQEYRPTEYLYGRDNRVLTQLELEQHIAAGDALVRDAARVVMIQCVGCREKVRNYCSRICCSEALKNALTLKDNHPETDVYILYRDMRSYSFQEDYYRKAADRDVRFVPWTPEERPTVQAAEDENGKAVVRVTVADPVLGQRLDLHADLLVLSAAIVPSEGSREASRLFKVAVSPDGFFQEAHGKLRPVDFAVDGVFHCGLAHYPKHIAEAVSQAYGAAGRAGALLSRDTVTASGSVCDVNRDACVSCGACVSVCTYGAIELRETSSGPKALVNSVLCKGDGLCNAVCPTSAISLKHFTDEQLLSQIDAATAEL
ncbi:MAG: 4Fe-4S dicluster domain-containing protein, partial [Polyangiaceae bacterium]|nr:4Fe-4S dicluster domain-containing protein [Polyangiaceae bacterium]